MGAESVPGFGGLEPARPISSAMLAETGQPGGSKTILLVEDERFVRQVAAEVLESAGYRLVIAGSGVEAREAYRRCGPVDLLLADVVMPGLNGRELAAEFESLYPHAGVLLMSGYAEQLASSNQKNCLAKPFSTDTLLKRVREVLESKSASTETAVQITPV
jgi:two-component system cell cycle sensor histidine kinase/response regulator CckA